MTNMSSFLHKHWLSLLDPGILNISLMELKQSWYYVLKQKELSGFLFFPCKKLAFVKIMMWNYGQVWACKTISKDYLIYDNGN